MAALELEVQDGMAQDGMAQEDMAQDGMAQDDMAQDGMARGIIVHEIPAALQALKEPSPILHCIICGTEGQLVTCGNKDHSMCGDCACSYDGPILDLISCPGCKTPEPVFYNNVGEMPSIYWKYIIKKYFPFFDETLEKLSVRELINIVETIIEKQKTEYYSEKKREQELKQSRETKQISSGLIKIVEEHLSGIITCASCENPVCQGDGCAALLCKCGAHICAICGLTITDDSFIRYPQYPNGRGPEGQMLFGLRDHRDLGHNHVDIKHNYIQDGDFAIRVDPDQRLMDVYFDPDGKHRHKFLESGLIKLLNQLLPKSSIQEIRDCNEFIYNTSPHFFKIFRMCLSNNHLFLIFDKDIPKVDSEAEVPFEVLFEQAHIAELVKHIDNSIRDKNLLLKRLDDSKARVNALELHVDALKKECNASEALLKKAQKMQYAYEKDLSEYKIMCDSYAMQQKVDTVRIKTLEADIKALKVLETGDMKEYQAKIKFLEITLKQVVEERDIAIDDIKTIKSAKMELQERYILKHRSYNTLVEKYYALRTEYDKLFRKLKIMHHPETHPLFKTQPCKFFNKEGGCKYGEKCAFKHEVKDE